MRSLLIWFLLIGVINFAVSGLRNHRIPNNYYLAEICTSVVLAFIFARISHFREGKNRFKNKNFYRYFRITGILFLLLDLVSFRI